MTRIFIRYVANGEKDADIALPILAPADASVIPQPPIVGAEAEKGR